MYLCMCIYSYSIPPFTSPSPLSLQVITKDSNVLVVALAANVVKGLATGLREGFQPLVPQVLPGMLGKFKEKKLGVVTALREAVDAVFLTVRAVCVCACACVHVCVRVCMCRCVALQ